MRQPPIPDTENKPDPLGQYYLILIIELSVGMLKHHTNGELPKTVLAWIEIPWGYVKRPKDPQSLLSIIHFAASLKPRAGSASPYVLCFFMCVTILPDVTPNNE